MNDLKAIGLTLLLLFYLVFGIAMLVGTAQGTGEYGAVFFFTGLTLSILLLIPAGWIGYYLYKHSDIFKI